MLDRAFLEQVTSFPGVYLMQAGEVVIYVGKAKNLKQRLNFYFSKSLPLRIHHLMEMVERIQTIVTRNEKEALLLESTLIKKYHPRFNIVFKDDRNYPYLLMTKHTFPQLIVRRKLVSRGDIFGPFPDGAGVRLVYEWLQKIFRLRTCDDSTFKYRNKPCLLYQIALCSAPCVGKISPEDYQENVRLAQAMLTRETSIVEHLIHLMEEAAQKQAYEKAAFYRDQISNYRNLQSSQAVVMKKGNLDLMAYFPEANGGIDLLKVRNGLMVSNQLFSSVGTSLDLEAGLENFIVQYYQGHESPKKLVTNFPISSALRSWLKTEKQIKPCKVTSKTQALLNLALLNAEKNSIAKREQWQKLGWDQLAQKFALRELNCLEGFDVSHYAGEMARGSWVAWTKGGIQRRLFCLADGADDLFSLQQTLLKRFTKRNQLPDLILVDGGEKQLAVAQKVLSNLDLTIPVLAISKGERRKEGLETIWTLEGEWKNIPPEAFKVLVKLRNEAHNKAILGNRHGMVSKRLKLGIFQLPGVGSILGKRLLNFFGGRKTLQGVGIDDLTKVPGISLRKAKLIYQSLHPDQLGL